jgi:hypothetical protein
MRRKLLAEDICRAGEVLGPFTDDIEVGIGFD